MARGRVTLSRMTTVSWRSLAALIGIALTCPLTVQGGPKSHGPMTQDAAVTLLLRTIKTDHVYDKRISLDCVSFDTEETTRTYFEIALRENHTRKCGGDPDTSPVIDRYRVNRASGRIEWNDRANDSWRSYDPARIR